jgi:hypothetical protein
MKRYSTKLYHRIFGPKPAQIEDTTSGPNAPNLEIACAPLTFAEHGFKTAPPGEKAFTMVSRSLLCFFFCRVICGDTGWNVEVEIAGL